MVVFTFGRKHMILFLTYMHIKDANNNNIYGSWHRFHYINSFVMKLFYETGTLNFMNTSYF